MHAQALLRTKVARHEAEGPATLARRAARALEAHAHRSWRPQADTLDGGGRRKLAHDAGGCYAADAVGVPLREPHVAVGARRDAATLIRDLADIEIGMGCAKDGHVARRADATDAVTEALGKPDIAVRAGGDAAWASRTEAGREQGDDAGRGNATDLVPLIRVNQRLPSGPAVMKPGRGRTP